jgi:hypothetical protein
VTDVTPWHILINSTGLVPMGPYFFGRILALLLELKGCCVLHGSVLGTGRHRLGLIGASGSGKSTLALAMALRRHWQLFSEDTIALHDLPGQPSVSLGPMQWRLTQASCQAFGMDPQTLSPLNPFEEKRLLPQEILSRLFGEEDTRPLQALITLRQESATHPPNISQLSPKEALLEVVRQSFGPTVIEALGLQPHRLPLLTALVRQCPVFCLHYPKDYQQLDKVLDLIESLKERGLHGGMA